MDENHRSWRQRRRARPLEGRAKVNSGLSQAKSTASWRIVRNRLKTRNKISMSAPLAGNQIGRRASATERRVKPNHRR